MEKFILGKFLMAYNKEKVTNQINYYQVFNYIKMPECMKENGRTTESMAKDTRFLPPKRFMKDIL